MGIGIESLNRSRNGEYSMGGIEFVMESVGVYENTECGW